MNAALETVDLDKRYGHTQALRDCSFVLPTGRVAALVGPNGAGKTTLKLPRFGGSSANVVNGSIPVDRAAVMSEPPQRRTRRARARGRTWLARTYCV